MAYTDPSHASQIQSEGGYNYIGNKDFRGWAYANPETHWALPFMGNDGSINQDAVNNYDFAAQGYGPISKESFVSGFTKGLTDTYNNYRSTAGQAWGDSSGVAGAYTYDPNAQQRANFMGQMPGALQNIRSSGDEAFTSGERSLRGSAEGLYNTINQKQRGIDRSRENVELNRMNAVKDILGFVRNGLKSGSARLSNMNANESSASGEIARAYGQIGGNRMRQVGNQSFLQNRDINTEQEGLDLQENQGMLDFGRSREELVGKIGSEVRQQLASLDSQARALGLSGPDVEAEKQRILDAGMGKVQAVQQWLETQFGGLNPQDMDTTRRNAAALQQGGTSDVTPFNFGQMAVTQSGSASNSNLPLFVRNRREE